MGGDGALVFCSCVIRAAKPYMRRMFDLLSEQGPRPRSSAQLLVSTEVRHDIEMWRRMLTLLNGTPITGSIGSPMVAPGLYTDASFGGWGVYFGGRVLMGAWPPHWVQRIGLTGGFEAHINFLEAVGLLFGLRMALPLCRGRLR
eukprot:COSAG05_NODE_9703_length_607_cov_1.086614_1_plen_143_part_10